MKENKAYRLGLLEGISGYLWDVASNGGTVFERTRDLGTEGPPSCRVSMVRRGAVFVATLTYGGYKPLDRHTVQVRQSNPHAAFREMWERFERETEPDEPVDRMGVYRSVR